MSGSDLSPPIEVLNDLAETSTFCAGKSFSDRKENVRSRIKAAACGRGLTSEEIPLFMIVYHLFCPLV